MASADLGQHDDRGCDAASGCRTFLPSHMRRNLVFTDTWGLLVINLESQVQAFASTLGPFIYEDLSIALLSTEQIQIMNYAATTHAISQWSQPSTSALEVE